MTAPESHPLQLILSLVLAAPVSYAIGRIHQWYTHSLRRDVAFREGYDHASHAMFDLAVQQRAAVPAAGPATITPPAAARMRRRSTDALARTLRGHPLPSGGRPSSHRVPGDRRERKEER
jgi:hypothetical protein